MVRGNLSISRLTPEEAHLYQELRHEVFRPTVNKVLYAREPSQATRDKIVQKTKEDIANGVLFMVCRDDDTGEMIAGARCVNNVRIPYKFDIPSRWRDVGPKGEAKERTWEEVDADLTVSEPYEESDPRIFNAVFSLFNQNKRKFLGTRSCYFLDTLVTHTEHHRRGAGGLLVQWGCEQADKKGVEAWLEASLMGAPLYERYGFQAVKKVSVDLRDFGGDEKLDFIACKEFDRSARELGIRLIANMTMAGLPKRALAELLNCAY